MRVFLISYWHGSGSAMIGETYWPLDIEPRKMQLLANFRVRREI